MTKRQTLILVGTVFGTLLLLWILLNTAFFVRDSFGRANGDIVTRELSIDEFTLHNFDIIGEEDGAPKAITTNKDAQLVLYDLLSVGTVRDLYMDMEFSQGPGEVALYYAQGDDYFSYDKRVWGTLQSDGSYTFVLPNMGVDRLRLDPTDFNGTEVIVNSIGITTRTSFFDYFIITYELVYKYIVYSFMISAFLGYVFSNFKFALKIVKAVAGKCKNILSAIMRKNKKIKQGE